MIPALPDKDDDNPPPLRPPAAATNSPQSAPAARLRDIYDRDVLRGYPERISCLLFLLCAISCIPSAKECTNADYRSQGLPDGSYG
jgi:hypothetical protein